MVVHAWFLAPARYNIHIASREHPSRGPLVASRESVGGLYLDAFQPVEGLFIERGYRSAPVARGRLLFKGIHRVGSPLGVRNNPFAPMGALGPVCEAKCLKNQAGAKPGPSRHVGKGAAPEENRETDATSSEKEWSRVSRPV